VKTGTEVKIGKTGLKPATREPPKNFKVSKAGLKVIVKFSKHERTREHCLGPATTLHKTLSGCDHDERFAQCFEND